MRTYILNASARRNGYCSQSAKLITSILEEKGASYDLDVLFDKKINYCRGCDSCKVTGECVIKDDMTPVYKRLLEADNLVILSPIQFSAPPAQLKVVLDRCQVFYNTPRTDLSRKNAYFVHYGGSKPYEEQFKGTEISMIHFLRNLNAKRRETLLFSSSDDFGKTLSDEVSEKIRALVDQIPLS
jgi:multimeric flavodoxin WrbA